MIDIKIKDFIDVINGQCDEKYMDCPIQTISKDTRSIKAGDLYVAIVGESFNGHVFVKDAIAKEACGVLVSQPVETEADLPIILVNDTVLALQKMASFYKERLGKAVIAITGSVGKTSTKNIVSTILSSKFNVHRTLGNYNNEIGLPLTVLDLEPAHDVIVLEMGMSAEGEIRTLTNIAKPNIAAITNIGISHIENLGSQENILKAKLEIAEGLDENGVLILNQNDPYLQTVDHSVAHKVIRVGIDIPADYTAYNIKNQGEDGMVFTLDINDAPYTFHIPAIGLHNVTNALIGIACALELGLSPHDIKEGFTSYRPEKMRLNIVNLDNIKFIDDSYNASPDSMKAGLTVLKSLTKEGRSIAILGNMFELGDMAASGHETVGKACKDLDIDFTAIIGENAADVARGIGSNHHYQIFTSHEEIVEFMKSFLKADDVVLLKGSRGMNMEKVLKLW